MYDKNTLRLCVDVTMTALYTALMFGAKAGLLFHELAGLMIALLFAFHFGLNFQMLRRIGGIKNSPKHALLLISDLLLPIGLIATILTGAMISRTVFTSALSGSLLVFTIHRVAAWFSAAILALHLLLHLRFVIGVCKSMVRRLREKGVLRALASCAAGLLILGVLFSRVYAVFYQEDASLSYASSVIAADSASGDQDFAVPPTVTEENAAEENVAEATPEEALDPGQSQVPRQRKMKMSRPRQMKPPTMRTFRPSMII